VENLSPKLFTLFIDGIIENMKAAGARTIRLEKFEIDMLLFADDIVLLALSARDLQIKIDQLKSFFERNKLNVNLSKTKVLVFGRGHKMKSHVFKWGENEIELVSEYTYLGIPFYYNGTFKKARENFFQKAKQGQDQLLLLFRKGKISKLEVQEKLFNPLCRSILFYGIVVWGLEHVKELTLFQVKFIRKLFFLSNETPRWKIYLETNIQPIENAFANFLVKFLCSSSYKPSQSLVKVCYRRLLTV